MTFLFLDIISFSFQKYLSNEVSMLLFELVKEQVQIGSKNRYKMGHQEPQIVEKLILISSISFLFIYHRFTFKNTFQMTCHMPLFQLIKKSKLGVKWGPMNPKVPKYDIYFMLFLFIVFQRFLFKNIFQMRCHMPLFELIKKKLIKKQA